MADPETRPPASRAGTSFMARLAIVGFMGLVILTECLLAYFWFPSAGEAQAHVEQRVAAEEQAKAKGQEEQASDDEPVVEMDLGKFNVIDHRPAANATFRTDFHLVGTVTESHQSEFSELYKRNEFRFRNLVLVEIRNSQITELTEPGLGLIKRRILEKSNELFGEPLLRSIVFSDYSFVDQ